jgi:hypothetical protein
MPTLFVGVGACAQATLAELSHLAQGLTVPIRGPFGLALADSRGEGLFLCDWLEAADFCFPTPALVRETSETIGPDDEKLVASLASLVRRLRAAEPGVEGLPIATFCDGVPGPGPGRRVRLSSYVAIDLLEPAAVAWSLRLMRVLRQVDAAVDTTVLALSARTAAPGLTGDHAWFETWKRLLEELQNGPFAQRVYILDGCDADKTWFERPEQLHRLGAEFLLYHGLTCRDSLRQNERARTGAQESLLNVCGSFGCRTISADLSVVAERVAERLAREDLADLYNRTVPGGWLITLQEQSRSLVERIAALCEKSSPAPASCGAGRDRPDARRAENAEIAEAIRRTVQHVCSREPLVSLCLFFQLLRPKLARWLSQQRLWERARIRRLIAQAFLRQEENTYEPTRFWLARPHTRWVDRFTPALPETGAVSVSRPAGMNSFLVGVLVLVVGLTAATLGISFRGRLVAAVGGLTALGASVLMVLPTGWTRHPRIRVQEGQEVPSSFPKVHYRKRVGAWTRRAGRATILAGLAGITEPWWFQVWSWRMALWAAVLAGLAGLGSAFVTRGPAQMRPDQASEEEAPGHAHPPVWWPRAAGLLCLAVAWTFFCWRVPLSAAPDRAVVWWAPLLGLVLMSTGVGVALFPRMGRTGLIDRVPKMPQPLAGGIPRPVPERQLPQRVAALAAWIERLILEPDQCRERLGAMDAGPRSRKTATENPTKQAREGATNAMHRAWEPGTLFDAVATDWEGQLAQTFRRAVEARSGKSLKMLALQPALWAECIMSQLQDSHPDPPGSQSGARPDPPAARLASPARSRNELSSLFALQAVKAWLDSHTLTELLSFLNIDLTRFGSLVSRLACVHWPAPRADPEASVTVIAVGKALWDAVAPLTKMPGMPALVLQDCDLREESIVILRVVQGLAQGWRGFPGMPGQLHGDARKSDRSSAGAQTGEPDCPAQVQA